MENCLNCGTKLRGKFCHNCGQEKITKKITLSSVTREFLRNSLHWESTIINTYKELFKHPGIFIRNYLAGKRKDFTKPISFYLIILAAYVILFHLLNDNFLEPIARAKIAAGESDIIFGSVSAHEFQIILSKYLNYIAFIAPLLLAAIIMLIFRNNKNDEGEKYSYAEYLIFCFYTQGAGLAISCVFILLSMLNISIWNYSIIAGFTYSIFSMVQFTKSKSAAGILKSILTLILSTALYFLVIFLIVLAYISVTHK